MDSNRDMAIHIAALAGRQLIVRDLLELGACIHEKNRDLMLPLNLACVDEAQGNGEVIRMLVEAGATSTPNAGTSLPSWRRRTVGITGRLSRSSSSGQTLTFATGTK